MRRLVAGMPAPPLELQVTGELVDASKNMRCASSRQPPLAAAATLHSLFTIIAETPPHVTHGSIGDVHM